MLLENCLLFPTGMARDFFQNPLAQFINSFAGQGRGLDPLNIVGPSKNSTAPGARSVLLATSSPRPVMQICKSSLSSEEISWVLSSTTNTRSASLKASYDFVYQCSRACRWSDECRPVSTTGSVCRPAIRFPSPGRAWCGSGRHDGALALHQAVEQARLAHVWPPDNWPV